MQKTILSIIILVFNLVVLSGQTKTLRLVLKDALNLEPVVGAHVFVLNSSYGTISGDEGQLVLDIPLELKERLVISHISYENHFISYTEYQSLDEPTIVTLKPNGLSLDEITIVAQRDKRWKENLKKFTKAFLGTDKAAKKAKILNPEVLRFTEIEDALHVTAVDLIQISNPPLGYNIDFLLKELLVSKDGSSQYNGYAKFTDISTDKNRDDVEENREKVFQKSRRYFLMHLIQGNTVENNYDIRFLEYNNSAFHEIGIPDPDSILTHDEHTETYHLWFDEFLDVTNKNFKTLPKTTANTGTATFTNQYANSPQSVGSPQSLGKTKKEHLQSQLYKLTPFLALDKYGHILNENSVKEYGYWANQRIAALLPWDYGIEFMETPIIPLDVQNSKQLNLAFFKQFIYGNEEQKSEALKHLEANWDDAYIPPLLEIVRMSSINSLTESLQKIINKNIAKGFNGSFYTSLEEIWNRDPNYPSFYGDYKAEIYQFIDPKFKAYFEGRQETAKIRLDEILWGGVLQDGIPPLRFPKMIAANDADYLEDNNVVFGFAINGVVRAYPKRILAWHEFFVDSFDDIDIAGVYCTLCGTVIAYDMTHDGVRHDLGTSGFLYRSNKLMYDKATQSLWNTIEGEPVLGPLAGKGIQLETHPVVTTTWGAWKKMHPDTEVLSLDTGHDRNYDEGNAYKEYYATDRLMFPVPLMDKQLDNKHEVFVIRVEGYRDQPKVFSHKFLKSNPVHKDVLAGTPVTILTDRSGASRAYATKDYNFSSFKNMELKDDQKNTWTVDEEGIHSSSGLTLERLPAHEIFWFAWVNSYPDTELIK